MQDEKNESLRDGIWPIHQKFERCYDTSETTEEHCRLDYPGLSGKRKGECSRSEGFPLAWFPVQSNLYTPINNNGKEFYRPLTAGLGAELAFH